jgi:hypothetical protein
MPTKKVNPEIQAELKLTPEMLLWKQLGITSCTMEFSCGGDSMNDYNFTFYKTNDKKGKNQPAQIEVQCPELESYFDIAVFNEVEFYVNSDGHYIGESGSVEIQLDEEDEEPEFTYSKNAQAEWSERAINVIGITLTDKELDFINNYVLNINGGESASAVVNYKKDFIMTDELETIKNDIEKKIHDEAREYTPDITGELDDWYSFTTNGEKLDELTIEGKELQLEMSNSYTYYGDSID